MREDFSSSTEAERRKLQPALYAAKAANVPAHLRGEKVVIQGKPYSSDSLDSLPENIKEKLRNPTPSKRLHTVTSNDCVVFYGRESPFSNFHQAEFRIDNESYCCTEQYYQSQKCENFNDDIAKHKVLSTRDPVVMKQIGDKVKGDTDSEAWKKRSREIMLKGNLAKFNSNPELKNALLSTGTKTLGECNPHCRIWSTGVSIRHKLATNPAAWRGSNYMGSILERVRYLIKSNPSSVNTKEDPINPPALPDGAR